MKFQNIDQYIDRAPTHSKSILTRIRSRLQECILEAQECISYNMPAIRLKSVIIYYAAYEGHIGFYPTPSAITLFKEELDQYETSKGAIKFKYDEPLPLDLIERIAVFRRDEITNG